jgi:hypothetical protein
MSSRFTFAALGSNPNAAKYAVQATQSSKVGSKNFVNTRVWDDQMPFPRHQARQADNPMTDFLGWIRYRWMFHDFRMFGISGAIRKHYYFGELWRRKDEKIFVGKDDNGNKYWFSRRSKGSYHTRFVEPVDAHWFRGQDPHCAPPMFQKWMTGNAAHTPAIMKARGEYGYNSRLGQPLPFKFKHSTFAMPNQGGEFAREPTYVPGPGMLVNPERKVLQDSGYTRWVSSKGNPQYMPFCGVHDHSDELLEEYYRGTWAFGRANKGNDHDEWKA